MANHEGTQVVNKEHKTAAVDLKRGIEALNDPDRDWGKEDRLLAERNVVVDTFGLLAGLENRIKGYKKDSVIPQVEALLRIRAYEHSLFGEGALPESIDELEKQNIEKRAKQKPQDELIKDIEEVSNSFGYPHSDAINLGIEKSREIVNSYKGDIEGKSAEYEELKQKLEQQQAQELNRTRLQAALSIRRMVAEPHEGPIEFTQSDMNARLRAEGIDYQIEDRQQWMELELLGAGAEWYRSEYMLAFLQTDEIVKMVGEGDQELLNEAVNDWQTRRNELLLEAQSQGVDGNWLSQEGWLKDEISMEFDGEDVDQRVILNQQIELARQRREAGIERPSVPEVETQPIPEQLVRGYDAFDQAWKEKIPQEKLQPLVDKIKEVYGDDPDTLLLMMTRTAAMLVKDYQADSENKMADIERLAYAMTEMATQQLWEQQTGRSLSDATGDFFRGGTNSVAEILNISQLDLESRAADEQTGGGEFDSSKIPDRAREMVNEITDEQVDEAIAHAIGNLDQLRQTIEGTMAGDQAVTDETLPQMDQQTAASIRDALESSRETVRAALEIMAKTGLYVAIGAAVIVGIYYAIKMWIIWNLYVRPSIQATKEAVKEGIGLQV